MKRTKRALSLMVTLLMLFGMVSGVSIVSSAESTYPTLVKTGPYVEISAAETTAGGSVKVPIVIGNNPGIWSIKFDIKYDKSILTFTGTEAGDVFSADDFLCSPLTNSQITLVAWPVSLENVTGNGTLVYLLFNVAAGAAQNDYALEFTDYSEENFFDSNLNNVAFTFGNGAVKVAMVQKVSPALDKSKTYLEVGSIKGSAGESIEVPVYIGNNPGVWGIKFSLKYNTSVLTLTGTECGTVFSESDILCSPLTKETFTFVGDAPGFANVTGSGLLITLKFNVAANAALGDYAIEFINYDEINFFNSSSANVPFTFGNGIVTVEPIIYGDVNGDGAVNGKDSLSLRQFIAEWNVDIISKHSDVTGDGSINGKDSLLLRQFLADWNVKLGV